MEELDPDLGILQRVAAGDVESFGVLMQRHEPKLQQLCYRLLKDEEAARDAVQEVFLKAFRNAAGFKPQAKVSTWLYRIAVNHSLNRLRRQKVLRFFSFGEMQQGPEEEPVELDPADERPGAEHALEARERWRRTRAAIEALPENQRLVLQLAKFDGLSQKEIAQVLEITEGAVESRLVRAMRTLVAADAAGSAQENAK